MSRIGFNASDWSSPAPGVREKVAVVGKQRLRLVEFTPEFVEEDWCTRGHIGYMLEGELEIAFEDHTIRLREGDGSFVPSGEASRHKATALTAVARLILEDDE